MVHATGNALVITATFTFTAVEFQNSVGKIFSWTRTAMNVAQMCGPSIGGALYGVGGFYVPFVVMGAVQVRAFDRLATRVHAVCFNWDRLIGTISKFWDNIVCLFVCLCVCGTLISKF